MSKPQRRREDGAVDFFGGPRDGERIVVDGTPERFVIPQTIKRPGNRGKLVDAETAVVYIFRDGAYYYLGQGTDDD